MAIRPTGRLAKDSEGRAPILAERAARQRQKCLRAWLAHHGKVNVIGLNLCRFNSDDRRYPSPVLRTLAFQIATRLPDYRRLLLHRIERQDPSDTELHRKSPLDLFNWLL